MSLIDQAARAMLAYERWLRERTTDGPYPGETADALIVRQVGRDIHAYVAIASPAIARANEIRGCSPTAVRIKDERSAAKTKERRAEKRTSNGQGKRDDGGRRAA
jgi:hypothetical protein